MYLQSHCDSLTLLGAIVYEPLGILGMQKHFGEKCNCTEVIAYTNLANLEQWEHSWQTRSVRCHANSVDSRNAVTMYFYVLILCTTLSIVKGTRTLRLA